MPNLVFDTKQGFTPQVHPEQLYDLPVDTATAFSNHKGIYKQGIERRQRKLLKKLSFLGPFLDPSERILQVTTGCSPISFLEQLLTGAILYSLKRALFVFTDRRILHIPCSPNLYYRSSIAQILYADCLKLRMRFSTLVAVYRSGRSEKFSCISSNNRRKIKAILKTVSYDDQTSPELERSHLCPKCSRPLIKNYYACPHCDLKFKTKPSAVVLSIIFPGGGYFYTRHPCLGILEAAMEIIFALMMAVITWAYFMQSFYSEIARQGMMVLSAFGPRDLGQAIAFCAIIIFFEKLVTILYANKSLDEFVPQQRHVKPQLEEMQEYHSSSKEEKIDSVGWRSR